jgi:hypothetical protein
MITKNGSDAKGLMSTWFGGSHAIADKKTRAASRHKAEMFRTSLVK